MAETCQIIKWSGFQTPFEIQAKKSGIQMENFV
jgi:hypothetical protein